MKTANLAIVFTDIKGFTERTSRQTLEQNQRLLQVHAALLTPLFKSFGGRVVKSIGDAFLATFESPTQAVLCGVAIQDRLWQHNRSAPEAERLDVRVAINVGEVRLESGDVFGEPVNIAARVEAIAEAGEVYFTEAVYLAMNKAEVPSEEVGSFELKGIPGKIRVMRVPRAPYRVQPTSADEPLGAGAPPLPPSPSEELPPFGNLGLSRLPESERSAAAALSTAGATAQALGQKAVALTARAASLGGDVLQRTTAALAGTRAGRKLPVNPKVAAAVGVVLLLGLFLVFRKSGLDKAIDEVASASESDREGKARVVRSLIKEERDPNDRDFDSGRLEEALGHAGRAVSFYERAAGGGHHRAQSRLIDLLDNPKCGLRADAARALGSLKLEKARGALESLAKSGGPDDEDSFFGCNSRKVAQEALQRLE